MPSALLGQRKLCKEFLQRNGIMIRIFFSTALVLGLAGSLHAAPTPTPTPTPEPSFLSGFKARANPSATPLKTRVAVGRGTHLGVDRSAQTPTPRPTPKRKPSAPTERKSPTATATPTKAAASPTPIPTPSPQKETPPLPSPTSSVSTATASPSPTPAETAMPTLTSTPVPTQSPTPNPTASTPSVSSPTKVELTLTKFEPSHGSPGDSDYRSAQLSYRINVPKPMEYPTINFTVETSSGKLFERVVRLPGSSAFVELGDNTEHTSALDPVPRDDWVDAYAKTDRAMFNWSIEGESSGGIEKPVKKAWP